MIKEKTGISYLLNAVVTSNIQGRTYVFFRSSRQYTVLLDKETNMTTLLLFCNTLNKYYNRLVETTYVGIQDVLLCGPPFRFQYGTFPNFPIPKM